MMEDQTENISTPFKPLVVINRSGSIIGVSRICEKGLKKSIESGTLWHRHPHTGRLIPFKPTTVQDDSPDTNPIPVVSIRDEGPWVRADVTVDNAETAAQKPAKHDEPKEGRSTTHRISEWGSVLTRLWDTVQARRHELPEGSYTTHLFTSGIDKIKKKTGEEAIELILAEEAGDTTHESADLLYHLFVLLAAKELDFHQVIAELETRSR